MNYIKDEYYVDKFIEEVLEKENSKTYFLMNDPGVREFSAHWLTFTDYYKDKFDKGIRDKDAIDKLKQTTGFKSVARLYQFRCKLFKADFILNNKFKMNLTKNIATLKKITTRLLDQKRKRNKYLIGNMEW
jgi:hypothetical protein